MILVCLVGFAGSGFLVWVGWMEFAGWGLLLWVSFVAFYGLGFDGNYKYVGPSPNLPE